ncbi:hypothetical protein [Psychrobacillus sp. NPDC093180]|uniref:hypothetical protein n=1 Tax=Psychrobacillus sp. NPDC093180 TaxID=3364489 RepID=UPI00380B3A45
MIFEPRVTSISQIQSESRTYDIVYIRIDLNYASKKAKLLYDKYVFVFTTNRNSEDYGAVSIELEKDANLSSFYSDVQERGTFHVNNNESMVINEFLELRIEEKDSTRHFVAYLKDQLFYKNHKPWYKQDIRVLLFSENGNMKDSFDNMSSLQLAPEFAAKIELDHYNDLKNYCRNGLRFIESIKIPVNDKHEKKILEQILQLAKEEEKLMQKKYYLMLDEYLNRLKQCRHHFRNFEIS